MIGRLRDLVKECRSIRRFSPANPVTREEMLDLLETARFCPSGANRQPLRYRLVSGDECAAVFPHTAWAALLKDWRGPTETERPSGYIFICSAAASASPDCDVGIAAQTICLAAREAGIAACMLGALRREEIAAALSLGKEWAIRLAVALGRPDETVRLEEVGDDGDTTYYRTLDAVHHVPKRRLRDILL